MKQGLSAQDEQQGGVRPADQGSHHTTGGSTPGIRAFIDAFAENASSGETGLAFGTGVGGVPTTKWRLGQAGHWTPAITLSYDINEPSRAGYLCPARSADVPEYRHSERRHDGFWWRAIADRDLHCH
ncbi:hypothetical protein [Brevundimonas sp. Leaf168]|uniref:hypothetical protein n=1 Tax=Brevundimonas sp. Leaf168 TaxID=1736283 RepID=UPI00071480F2|nr:hypothetical protein [Brevundimonas sp. Leaf168]KQR52980.1 hypothetical protein ASF81_12030 [Brevundimonas sp. Leaf168]